MKSLSYAKGMFSIDSLNPEQREAASAIEGPLLILAGAGTGKTRTITFRMAHMVANLGIKPNSILGVTFTNKAAKEMQERLGNLIKVKKADRPLLCTFHKLGLLILKKEISKLGYHKNFSIYGPAEQSSIIREALKKFKAEKSFDRKMIMASIGNLKNRGISEIDYADSELFDPDDPYSVATEYCYRFYQDKLHFYNAIDFDDILRLTIELFRKHPEIAEEYSRKYQYIMVDEYQDTNSIQFEMVRALTSTHDNLCVVGDDDQSIYGFRGADITNILSFEKHFPRAKVIKLEQNYRSTSPILDLANNVIKVNKERRDKNLWSNKQNEHDPLLWAMSDSDHEAQVIVEEITQYQAKGFPLHEVAILYRSNTQIPPFEDELRLSQVPYTIFGGQKFYEKKEIKDLIAYMQVLLNPHDQLAMRRILNVPNRGIGNVTLKKFIAISEEQNCSLYNALKKNTDIAGATAKAVFNFVELIEEYRDVFKSYPLPQAISKLVEKIDYNRFIDKQYDQTSQATLKKNDVAQFIESAERFIRNHPDKASLENYVEQLLLQDVRDKENEPEDDEGKANRVNMMTLHTAKGLEFNLVFLVGMEEELLPHKKCIAEAGGLSEERRLAYVGVTRARERLIMSYCKERMLYGKKTPRFRSRFINELNQHYIEQDRTTFGHLSEEEAEDYKKSFFANLMDTLD